MSESREALPLSNLLREMGCTAQTIYLRNCPQKEKISCRELPPFPEESRHLTKFQISKPAESIFFHPNLSHLFRHASKCFTKIEPILSSIPVPVLSSTVQKNWNQIDWWNQNLFVSHVSWIIDQNKHISSLITIIRQLSLSQFKKIHSDDLSAIATFTNLWNITTLHSHLNLIFTFSISISYFVQCCQRRSLPQMKWNHFSLNSDELTDSEYPKIEFPSNSTIRTDHKDYYSLGIPLTWPSEMKGRLK
jgi:hypothetical protein